MTEDPPLTAPAPGLPWSAAAASPVAPTPTALPGAADAAALPGVLVGHDTDTRRPTGVTVVILPPGTTAGVAVRGAAPGTRETDLLDPTNTVEAVDAIALCGGSAYGLDAATGVMGWLESAGRGEQVGPVRVPIVPAAVLFDLFVGDASIRPDAESGRRACAAALPLHEAARGSVGAGAGATVGKLLGPAGAMRGGVGIASLSATGVTVAAVVAVNAVGDVLDPATGTILAGARPDPSSAQPVHAVDVLLAQARLSGSGRMAGMQTATGAASPLTGTNTTIGVLVTDAALTKTQASRLSSVAHDGLARTIRPAHTTMDGDTLFVAATGTAAVPAPDMLMMSMLTAEVTALAVLDAVRSAAELRMGDLWLPAARTPAQTGTT